MSSSSRKVAGRELCEEKSLRNDIALPPTAPSCLLGSGGPAGANAQAHASRTVPREPRPVGGSNYNSQNAKRHTDHVVPGTRHGNGGGDSRSRGRRRRVPDQAGVGGESWIRGWRGSESWIRGRRGRRVLDQRPVWEASSRL
eukprot:g38013.t1